MHLKLSIRLHLFLLNLPLILFLITKYSFAIKNETFVPSPPPMFLPIQNMPRPSFVPEMPQIVEKSTNQTDGQKPILVVPNGDPLERQNVEEKVQRKNKTTNYNETYAHIMMGLSGAAYVQSPNACVQRLMPDPTTWRLFSQHKQICDSANNTCLVYSIVSMERRELVVVFRGTRSKEQLFTEGWESLQPDLEFYGICKVNRYFAAALNVLWPNVEMALNDSKHKDFNVTFTGHSLGGALASLASIKAVLEGLTQSERIKLYTFGQPRVGCSKFAAKHDELVPESFRVVFRSDVVPHMPPCAKNNQWALLDSFTSKPCDPSVPARAFHHGIEIWYPTAANYYIECIGIPRGEDFRCSDLLSFDLSKIENYISDHRHYLGHKLTAFASLDCDPAKKHLEETLEEGDWEEEAKSEKKQIKKKEGILETIVAKVKMVGQIIGIL